MAADDGPEKPADGKRRRREVDPALIASLDKFSKHAGPMIDPAVLRAADAASRHTLERAEAAHQQLADQAAKAQQDIEKASRTMPPAALPPIDTQLQRLLAERRELQDAADRAAIEHMPAMAAAIVQMAEQGKSESRKTTWILRLAIAAFAVAVVGVIIAALH